MSMQLNLEGLDLPPLLQLQPKSLLVEEQFQEFHDANPLIFEKLLELALQKKRGGRGHYGISALYEIVRHEMDNHAEANAGAGAGANADPGAPYKMDNNFKPFYSRMLMEQAPELIGFFETRRMKSE